MLAEGEQILFVRALAEVVRHEDEKRMGEQSTLPDPAAYST
jgi:hypothetical protein